MKKKKVKAAKSPDAQKIILYLGPEDITLATEMKDELEQSTSLRISWSAFLKHCIRRVHDLNNQIGGK